MKGTMAMMAADGAKRASLLNLFMKLAMVVAGMWFVGARKPSRWRRSLDLCLLWRMLLSSRE